MSNAVKEFFIQGCVTGISGKVTLIGRAGSCPIPRGTLFTLIYRNKQREYPKELEQKPIRIEERTVRVQIEVIHAYNKELDVLPANSTGCLVFSGGEKDMLPNGWILSAEEN